MEASEGGGVMPSRLADCLRWYVVEKGAVSVDGVSLSVGPLTPRLSPSRWCRRRSP